MARVYTRSACSPFFLPGGLTGHLSDPLSHSPLPSATACHAFLHDTLRQVAPVARCVGANPLVSRGVTYRLRFTWLRAALGTWSPRFRPAVLAPLDASRVCVT